MKLLSSIALSLALLISTLLSGCGAIEKSAAGVNTKNGLPGNTYTVWQTAPSGIFPKDDVDGSEQYQFDKTGNYTIRMKDKPTVKGKYLINKTLITDADTGNEIFTVENIGGNILRAKKPDGTKIFCRTDVYSNSIYGKWKMTYANDGSSTGSGIGGTMSIWTSAAYVELTVSETTVSLGIVDKATGKKTSYDNLPYKRMADIIDIDNGRITIQMVANMTGYYQAIFNATNSKGVKGKATFNIVRM